MNFLQKFRDFVSNPSQSRTMGLLVTLVLVSAVFLTVTVAQQQQTLKQRAAGDSTSKVTSPSLTILNPDLMNILYYEDIIFEFEGFQPEADIYICMDGVCYVHAKAGPNGAGKKTTSIPDIKPGIHFFYASTSSNGQGSSQNYTDHIQVTIVTPTIDSAVSDSPSTGKCIQSGHTCTDGLYGITQTDNCEPIDGISHYADYFCNANGIDCSVTSSSCPNGETCELTDTSVRCVKSGSPTATPTPTVIPTPIILTTLTMTLNTLEVSAAQEDIPVNLALYSNNAINTPIAGAIAPSKLFTKTSHASHKQYYASGISIDTSELSSGTKYTIISKKGNLIARSSFTFSGQTQITATPATLVSRDLNSDNSIDILDHNIVKDCMKKSVTSSPNCTTVDFDSNGIIDQIDYNAIMKAWLIWNKEGII